MQADKYTRILIHKGTLCDLVVFVYIWCISAIMHSRVLETPQLENTGIATHHPIHHQYCGAEAAAETSDIAGIHFQRQKDSLCNINNNGMEWMSFFTRMRLGMMRRRGSK